ncbi:glycosyltransferase family protein [Pelosinus baikalensis]|uniref:Glycosyltransferase family protein n=1 Tax=Pelosinus baikalensis TaxID=2892015 RepID=A0ABS8HNB8_9FIRM|nr:glycosyltransferase family protein [Pelosinus baikalensis]MCC5464039.1 glycosyltransferase family protein [Pelosinus baikalensis]
MKTVIIVQARMTSTRLPGKVLKAVLGKPLLEYQIERLRRIESADEIVIATTTNDTDQPIVDLCNRLNLPYFRGSEEDVLARYYGAAIEHRADAIVRITSDCPVIDPGVINSIIGFYIENKNQYDYVSNSLKRTYPRGMDTEVFSFHCLQESFKEAQAGPDREHVTPFIYNNPSRFRLANVSHIEDQSKYRWTVDTPEDYELIRRIIENLYPLNHKFTLEDILQLFQKNPGWFLINSHVEQKIYGK